MLRFIDGFTHWQQKEHGIQKGWVLAGTTQTVASPARFTGSRSLQIDPAYGAKLPVDTIHPGLNFDDMTVGFAFYMPSSSPPETLLAIGAKDAAVNHVRFAYNASNNKIALWWQTTKLWESTSGYAPGVWHYMAVRIAIRDSLQANQFVIWINGTQVGSLPAGTKTRHNSSPNALIGQLVFGFSDPPGNPMHMTDLYVQDWADTVRVSPRIITLMPNANGNYSQWTNSNGNSVNNFSYVNSSTYQTTTFVQSNTVGQRDSYNFADLPSGVTSVHGVQLVALARKFGAGARSMKLFLRQGGSDYDASWVNVLPDSPQYFRAMWMNRPSDNQAWTVSDVNALEGGVKVEA